MLKIHYIIIYALLVCNTNIHSSQTAINDFETYKSEYDSLPPEDKGSFQNALIAHITSAAENIDPNKLQFLEYTQADKPYDKETITSNMQKLLKHQIIQQDPDNPATFIINPARRDHTALHWIAFYAPPKYSLILMINFLNSGPVAALDTQLDNQTPEQCARYNNPSLTLFLQQYRTLHPQTIIHSSPKKQKEYNNLYQLLTAAFKSFMLHDNPNELHKLLTTHSDAHEFFYQEPNPNNSNYLGNSGYHNYLLLLSLTTQATSNSPTPNLKSRRFFKAIRNGWQDVTRCMLKKGYNPNTAYEELDPLEYYKIYPLHAAIAEGNFVAVRQLLKYKASLATIPFGHQEGNAASFAIDVFFKHNLNRYPRKPYLKCLKLILQQDQENISKHIANTDNTLLEHAIKLYKEHNHLVEQDKTDPDYFVKNIDPEFELLDALFKFGANPHQTTTSNHSMPDLAKDYPELRKKLIEQQKIRELQRIIQ